MSTPLRVSNGLFQAAEAEGSLLNRSTAKQVEYWAELGKKIAHTITPVDMLALMQGIARVRVEIPAARPLDPLQIFATVDQSRLNTQLGQQITRGSLYYESSISRPGLLDQVKADGSRLTGRFSGGVFLPE